MADAHIDAIGLWQLRETQSIADRSGRQPNDVYIFRYDGDTVTLRLPTLQDGVWKSDDDFYRLDARWNGSRLEYRPPFAGWAELASFEGDHFENVGSGTRRIFARIGDDEVADWNAAILKPRARHDYSVRPEDGPPVRPHRSDERPQ
jgi:hypothetical protein